MNTLRTIIELLSRDKVIKRKITVAGNSFPLLVSPDAQLKYLKLGDGAFDQDLIEIAENHLNDSSNVWDVGANVGVFTFAAGAIVKNGTVLSIEADSWLVNLLRKTAMFNEYASNISILPAAISNKNSISSFLVAQRGRASNALEAAGGRSQMGGVREKQLVPTLTLDSLLNTFSAPDFVKIDVEGAEYMVLEGSTNLINSIRPKFYIEVGSDISTQVFKLFKSANYIAYDNIGNKLDGNCTHNTFFIPKEKNFLAKQNKNKINNRTELA